MKNLKNLKNQKGFTLIELMIVIAIIGILSAIAIPQYQNYIAKSEAGAGLATINPLKTAAEETYASGKIPTDGMTVNELGTTADASDLGTISTDLTVAGTGNIEFLFADNTSPKTQKKTITLNRSDTGSWSCSTDIEQEYAPRGCTATPADPG